jgi:hypothetical protein
MMKRASINKGFVKNYFLQGLEIENANNVMIYIILENKNKAFV